LLRKLIIGGSALAIAAAAILLVTLGGSPTVTAAVNGISAAPTTVNPGAQVTVTIDADDDGTAADDPLRVIATAGDFIACTDADAAACLFDAPAGAVLEDEADNDQDVTITDGGAAASDLNTIFLTWEAPDTGPATVTITAIQGTSSKSVSITVRGVVATVDVVALTVAPAAGSTCPGTAVKVINGTTATALNGGQAAANLCTLVRDSAGNRVPNSPVIYSTTDGTVAPLTDVTGGTGNSAVASALTAGTSCAPGDKATVTASSGGVTDTVEILCGGDPATCSLTPNPTSVTVGGSSKVTAAVKDITGGPVPDGIFAAVAQVNPGSGANAAILGSPAAMTNGSGTVDVIAAIAGAIALGGTTPVNAAGGGIAGASPQITCTNSIIATGVVVTATGTGTAPAGGSGAIVSGSIPKTGGFGLIVWGGGNVSALVTATGCPQATMALWATIAGEFVVYVPGTTIGAVNAAFMAAFPGGAIPANTALLGKCV
jgi:hypothetical protein